MGVAVINNNLAELAPLRAYEFIKEECNWFMLGCSVDNKSLSPYNLCASSIIISVFLRGSTVPFIFSNIL